MFHSKFSHDCNCFSKFAALIFTCSAEIGVVKLILSAITRISLHSLYTDTITISLTAPKLLIKELISAIGETLITTLSANTNSKSISLLMSGS